MKKDLLAQQWWKYIGAILTIAIIVGGLVIPLRTGIVNANPQVLPNGKIIELAVEGYNTQWSSGNDGDIRVWLKYDDEYALKSSAVRVVNDALLRAQFEIPLGLPKQKEVALLSIIVDHPIDGVSVVPDKVIMRSIENKRTDYTAWRNKVSDLNFRTSIGFPYRNLLGETIRNQFYHVPLWFAMFALFLFSVIKSIHNLRSFSEERDRHVVALNEAGILLGILGLATGMLWAQFTWNKFWSWDIKQTMTLIALLIYFAYYVLRSSIDDPVQKYRASGVYNIFAFVMMITLLFVVPRMSQNSLHPGSGGNPAFGGDDLDNTMKLLFYPAIMAWALIGFWMASLRARILRLHHTVLEKKFDK